MYRKSVITIIAGVALTGMPVSAYAAGFGVRTSENSIEVSGNCDTSSGDVIVHLVSASDPSKGVYTSGASCNDGSFTFSDDLRQWHFPDGRYAILVNGKGTGKTVEKKSASVEVRSDEPEPTAAAKPAIQDVSKAVVSVPNASGGNFLDAFVALQQSLLDMRVRLADSDYPDAVKAGLDAAIDGIDALAGKMTDLLFASETNKNAVASETVNPVMSASDSNTSSGQAAAYGTSSASVPDSKTDESTPTPSGDATGLLSSDGLSIAGGSVSGATDVNGR